MKVILSNGKELNPILVTGAHSYVQGANRDTLSFIFPADTSLDELDGLFTAANCETIKLKETDTHEYIYNGYTIRTELKRAPVEITPATETEAAVYENRVTVSMAQRTYVESQLASLVDTVDVLVMESLTE